MLREDVSRSIFQIVMECSKRSTWGSKSKLALEFAITHLTVFFCIARIWTPDPAVRWQTWRFNFPKTFASQVLSSPSDHQSVRVLTRAADS